MNRSIKKYNRFKSLIAGFIVFVFFACPSIMVADSLYSISSGTETSSHCYDTDPCSTEENQSRSTETSPVFCSLNKVEAKLSESSVEAVIPIVIFSEIVSFNRLQPIELREAVLQPLSRGTPSFYLLYYFTHAPPTA